MFDPAENPFAWLGASPADFELPAVVELPLGCSGAVVLYDRDMLPLLQGYRWLRHSCGKGKLYARAEPIRAGVRTRVYMHRIVCEAVHGPAPLPTMVADHRNGNGLDNRAANLVWRDRWVNRWRHGAE